jgi:8-oxo-dGTP pyrophosphatase MutT (NUDIX family)/esterase/lipase
MTDIYLNDRRYRQNVGVVLFNRDGKVWLGRRADGRGEKIWQFPQGGVDRGEDVLDAARRELWEETGVRSASLIGRAPGRITYDFPEGFTGSKAMKGFAGQSQVWFAFRFEGEDAEVNLAAHHQIEFDAWRWADLAEAPDLVAPFKREAYLKVVEAFAPIARGEPLAEGGRGAILMIHGVNCTGMAWERLAADFQARGWTVRTPTLKADLRVKASPSHALAAITLEDYLREAEGWARALEAETGRPPVLFGHSMGGLIVQKLMEMGVGRAGVLVTPAPPSDARGPVALSTAFTFLNVLLTPGNAGKALKPWRAGFDWGVLNVVPPARRPAIYAEAVYDSGKVYQGLSAPGGGPEPVGVIDETRITAPILTIGAGRDRTTPVAGVRAVAAKYAKAGGDYREYPDNGHWIVDEPGTDRMAADIDAWLDAKLG